VNYGLVALDLDGTLIGPDLLIAPVVREAIGAVQARGVHVTLATGRQFAATLPFAMQLDLRTPLICHQGALIRDPRSGETLAHTTMPAADAAEATALLLGAGIFVIAYIDERLHVAASSGARRAELDYYLRFHPEEAAVVVEADLPTAQRATPPTKLLFIADEPSVGRELAHLKAHFAARLAITRSHEHFGELMAPGVGKGVALARLAGHLGIARERVIAIGDQENDLSMIAWAGLGLAMGNAIPAVRNLANATLPTLAEDGVATALQRYVLDAATIDLP